MLSYHPPLRAASPLQNHSLKLPGSAPADWACKQVGPLVTNLFCRAWKALGAVLLGIVTEGVGLTEEGLSVAGLGLGNEKENAVTQARKLV